MLASTGLATHRVHGSVIVANAGAAVAPSASTPSRNPFLKRDMARTYGRRGRSSVSAWSQIRPASALDLEPDVRAALVHAPLVCERLDQVQAPAADLRRR